MPAKVQELAAGIFLSGIQPARVPVRYADPDNDLQPGQRLPNKVVLLISGLVLFVFVSRVLPPAAIHAGMGHAGTGGLAHWQNQLRNLLLLFCLLLSLQGHNASQFIQIWVPPWPWRQFSYQLMIAACILMAAAILPRSWLQARLHLPALPAISLWGVAHLISNGDLASMLLFGTLTLWSLWQYARLFPGCPPIANKEFSVQWDVAAIMAGLLIWISLYLGHGNLFGTGLDIWFLE